MSDAQLVGVLENQSRNPRNKHEILEILARSDYELPDTPIMASRRGDVVALERH